MVVNGKSFGIISKNSFRIDISKPMKSGKNTLEVKVTNLLGNRLIGDEQRGFEKKIIYTTMPFDLANSLLLTSGLVPVQLINISE